MSYWKSKFGQDCKKIQPSDFDTSMITRPFTQEAWVIASDKCTSKTKKNTELSKNQKAKNL